MTHQRPHDGDRSKEDFAARPYANMPSVTSRAWGEQDPRDDRFGPAGLGGWGDFREGAPQGHRDQGSQRSEARGHRGRGPRNATRSDTAIADEIYFRLTEDDHIDASEILVGVEGGVVTLTGEVPERRMKHLAEDLVANVRGVQEVKNVIRVDRGEKSFGPPGREWRSGESQKGSGFSSASPGHAVSGPRTVETETGEAARDEGPDSMNAR